MEQLRISRPTDEQTFISIRNSGSRWQRKPTLWEYPTGLCPVLVDIHARVGMHKLHNLIDRRILRTHRPLCIGRLSSLTFFTVPQERGRAVDVDVILQEIQCKFHPQARLFPGRLKMRDGRNNPQMAVEGSGAKQTKCSLIPRGEHSSIGLMIDLQRRCIGESA